MQIKIDKINVSRAVTRRVRGLHLAVLKHNKTGRYHGNGMLMHSAVALAKRGAYGQARALLRDVRSNGRDRRMNEFADVASRAGGVHNEVQRANAQFEETKAYRITPAAAKMLQVTGRVTAKYVEVSFTGDELKAMTAKLSNIIKNDCKTAKDANTLRTAQAALKVLR